MVRDLQKEVAPETGRETASILQNSSSRTTAGLHSSLACWGRVEGLDSRSGGGLQLYFPAFGPFRCERSGLPTTPLAWGPGRRARAEGHSRAHSSPTPNVHLHAPLFKTARIHQGPPPPRLIVFVASAQGYPPCSGKSARSEFEKSAAAARIMPHDHVIKS